MSELGLDVFTGPVKRLVCLLRGHKPGPVDRWWGAACQRCGHGVIPPSFRHGGPHEHRAALRRPRCDCHLARPIERDLTGHRYDCPLHPPAGWPHDHQRPVGRVRVIEDEHGIRLVPWADQRPAEERVLVLDPLDRLWQLGDDGRVNREVSREELESWGTYVQPTDLHAVTGAVVHLPARYRGIPYRIIRVDWAEYARLGGPPPGPPNPPRPPRDRPVA